MTQYEQSKNNNNKKEKKSIQMIRISNHKDQQPKLYQIDRLFALREYLLSAIMPVIVEYLRSYEKRSF
jgi:hypothetical protein